MHTYGGGIARFQNLDGVRAREGQISPFFSHDARAHTTSPPQRTSVTLGRREFS